MMHMQLRRLQVLRCVNHIENKHGLNAIAVMPTNLYGPNDNFDLDSSHVLPALMAKFHGSLEKSEHWVVKLWGDGSPKREFLHVDDLAEALYICMEKMMMKRSSISVQEKM